MREIERQLLYISRCLTAKLFGIVNFMGLVTINTDFIIGTIQFLFH